MAKHVPPYPTNITKQEWMDKASLYYSLWLELVIVIDNDNCAKFLHYALRHRKWLLDNHMEIPVEFRRGLAALYGANMGRLKGM